MCVVVLSDCFKAIQEKENFNAKDYVQILLSLPPNCTPWCEAAAWSSILQAGAMLHWLRITGGEGSKVPRPRGHPACDQD